MRVGGPSRATADGRRETATDEGMANETKEDEEDVCFDPDAYEDDDDDEDEGRGGKDDDDDDDGTRPTTTGAGPTIDDALRRATAERREEMDAFDAMLVEKFPGTTGADARSAAQTRWPPQRAPSPWAMAAHERHKDETI